MSKSSKLVLGGLTILPLVALVIYFVWFFTFFLNMIESEGQADPNEFFSNFIPMFALIGFASLLSLGLLIYYIVHISKNPRFQKPGDSNKLVWILVIIFAGFIGQMVYFFLEVWPDRDTTHPELIDQLPRT